MFSLYENEKYAARKIIPILLLNSILLAFHIYRMVPEAVQITVVLLFISGIIFMFIRFGNKEVLFPAPDKKFDERDIMFSRMELKAGTDKMENYYRNKPENKQKDDLFRNEPGLLNPKSKFYNPFLFNAAEATFSTVELLNPLVESDEIKMPEVNFNSKEITDFISKWTKKLGAADVGITWLQPYHTYSIVGRGAKYGEKVELNHKFAIAFTVEMDHETMSYNPSGPVIMESAQQYLNAGTIAVQVAQFIRNLGFKARAHIDANYRVICPIVAQDAGLGTIGRMGLLITPKLGPRVRIGVVTTNLELVTNNKPLDSSIIHFCEICQKCAVNCPSNAISLESSKKATRRERWTINHESCFTYWCKVGTDCGRCVAVCPYSHPNNFLHNSVRWFIGRNPVNRWIMLNLDNFFYHRKPPINKLADWINSEISS